MNSAARLLNQGMLSRSWVISLLIARFQLVLAALIFALGLTALSIVYVTNETRSLNASLQQSWIDHDRLQIQWGQLLLEKSTWLMQARVQAVAEHSLNMKVPDNKSVVIINE
jgi:cell division protein FtsL